MLPQDWHSSPEYQALVPDISLAKFFEITDLLLERPNLNSSHLFRADILYDSAENLQTIAEKERIHANEETNTESIQHESTSASIGLADALPKLLSKQGVVLHEYNPNTFVPDIQGFTLQRTVVRKLIPRKPQIDRPLEQSCFIYSSGTEHQPSENGVLVVYVPHVQSEESIPWYHPKVRTLAYHFTETEHGKGLSVHYQLFLQAEDIESNRLHRTMLSLLQTFIRLSKHDAPSADPSTGLLSLVSARPVHPSALKDTILPQHIVQDTYTRLKQEYAFDLISRWIEKTEPSKHVFEDLAIAAFLIELWNTMYKKDEFPGFVDIACGNGVLVYILAREGYAGRGFDARRRKTWEVLDIDQYIEERLCIPKPFFEVLTEDEVKNAVGDIALHNGIFDSGTFVISNHADELTPWTPILAAMSHTERFLPFLSIPCCSHALSGGKYRYTIKDIDVGIMNEMDNGTMESEQLATGDLKALRAQKAKAANHGDDKSTYACLTKKTVALAEELCYETEMTLIRIPSTRNIGIVGNRHRPFTKDPAATTALMSGLLERECGATGGVKASALAWLERARKHIEGQGRGKVNLKGKSNDPKQRVTGLEHVSFTFNEIT